MCRWVGAANGALLEFIDKEDRREERSSFVGGVFVDCSEDEGPIVVADSCDKVASASSILAMAAAIPSSTALSRSGLSKM